MPISDRTIPATAVQALERLGRLTLSEHSMETLLQSVTDLAASVMPGDTEVAVTLLVNHKPTTTAYTGQRALDCDESQYGHGYGPCLHAATTGEVVVIDDARTERRWAAYSRQAAERGALSSLSTPLIIGEPLSGALNMYGREANAFDASTRSIAARFAPYAAVAVANMSAYQSARRMADNLEVALASRAVIDQAKGILMERLKVTAVQAFELLAKVSMRSNTKLRDVAEELVETGKFPHR